MRNQEQSQPKEWAPEGRELIRGGMLLLKIPEIAIVPFLRHGGGVDSPGRIGFLALIAIPTWAGISHSSITLNLFVWAWLPALAFYRLTADREAHSEFLGNPWLARIFFEDFRAASLAEALGVLAFGCLVRDRGLSLLLMAAGASSLSQEVMFRAGERRRRIAYRNALIEMEIRNSNLEG